MKLLTGAEARYITIIAMTTAYATNPEQAKARGESARGAGREHLLPGQQVVDEGPHVPVLARRLGVQAALGAEHLGMGPRGGAVEEVEEVHRQLASWIAAANPSR